MLIVKTSVVLHVNLYILHTILFVYTACQMVGSGGRNPDQVISTIIHGAII